MSSKSSDPDEAGMNWASREVAEQGDVGRWGVTKSTGQQQN